MSGIIRLKRGWQTPPGAAVYLNIAVKSYQKHLAYRAANLAGILTNTFFGAIYIYVFVALYKGHAVVGGLDVRDAVTYAIVSQSLLMAMSAFGNRELSEAIMKGDIVTDLSRPVSFYLLWAGMNLGRAFYYFVFRGIPTFVLGWALFGARMPVQPLTWLWFLATVAMGMLVSFAFRFITSSLAFWTTDARGITYLADTILMFFGGFMVPLNFMPPTLRAVAEFLPFRGLAQLPIVVFLEKMDPLALGKALALQGAWLIVLVIAGRAMLRAMVERLTVNGG